MSNFDNGITRQAKGPLTERERQTVRYMMELTWSGLRSRQKWTSTLKWVTAGIAAALAATQLPESIAKFIALFHRG